jgi:beta-galactosidase
VDTVELFLNGRSLGVRTFDHKTTGYGRPYLETTEATGDDKTVTSGPFPGSYTSPNGSAGKLHLTWEIPFAAGKLVAVARKNGVEVARDELRTASAPRTLRLTPDRRTIAADGRSLSFITVDVVDAAGVMVPGADDPISFNVHNGRLVGLDNGRQESAENYKSTTRSAFNGKALAIVQAGDRPGPITITATAPGLRPARTTVFAGSGPHFDPPDQLSTTDSEPVAIGVGPPTADASYSGAPTTLPAAMLDGNTQSGGWSNFYVKAATALLPTISRAHEREWVSVSWPTRQTLGTATLYFTTDAARALPASIEVKYWNGNAFVPVTNPRIDWASASNQPTTITFDRVDSDRLRFDLTSRTPDTATGFIQIAELQVTPG